jgi:hypothetical protein
MNADGFDHLTRAFHLTRTRRAALQLLATGTLGAWLGRPDLAVAATCRGAGADCHRDSQCCGRCTQKDKCRATRRGTCQPEANLCTGTGGTCNDQTNCFCFRTVSGGTICGESSGCVPCTSDENCFEDFGAKAACIDTAGAGCGCGGKVCIRRCSVS